MNYTLTHYSNKELSFQTLYNSYILPWNNIDNIGGGVVDEYGIFQESSAWHETKVSGYIFNKSKSNIRDEEVLYIGCLFDVWGHAITDNLKKIWYITKEHPSIRMIYITVNNKPLPKHVFDIFLRANIDLTKAEHITRLTKFKSILNPDNSLINNNEKRYYTKEFIDTIDTILRGIPTIEMDKVYFTRTQLKQNNRDIGEEYVERLFKKKGFIIYAPEKHSIKEQLTVLANCKTFCSTEGSISHSTIFCKKNTNVIILRKADYINSYTQFINEMRRLKVIYIKAHHSSLASQNYPWLGPFYIYVTKELSQFLGYHGIHTPHYLIINWYEYRFKIWSRITNWYYKKRASLRIKTRLKRLLRRQ